MPRTVEEILAHADELAARFEQYDPRPEDELDVGAIAALRAAFTEHPIGERPVIDAVSAARQMGRS